MNAVHAIMRTVVLHRADFCWIGEHAASAVAPNGVLRPAVFPELVGRGEEILGDIVTVIMGAAGVEIHAAAAAVEIAGDDVPADAALREAIQRREPVSEMIGMIERQVGGDAEAICLVTCAIAETNASALGVCTPWVIS